MQVLVVEDSPIYRHLITSHLQDWGFSFVVAKNGAEALKCLQSPARPKLVLLDWVLPDISGIELCRKIREAGSNNSYSYVILLTAKDGKEDLLDGMNAGADDYLAKPFDERELKARLLVGKRIVALHDELVAARESMRYAATHDSLTGILNRGEVVEMLKLEMERARRAGKPVSVVLADVDHFKKINDTFGHPFGDKVLKEVAKCLRSKLRVYDGVGRYGGEEFLLVLTDCNLMNAIIKADDIRASISKTPFTSGTLSSSLTVSMGVGVSTDHPAGDVAALLNQADQGLYRAKANGRNRVEHFEEATDVVVVRPTAAKGLNGFALARS